MVEAYFMTQDWFNQVAKSALCDPETLEATYDIACSLIRREVPGDFVEAGVYAGAHCAVMAQAIRDVEAEFSFGPLGIHVQNYKSGKRVHLFDSFTGIPQHGQNDI